MESTPTSFRCSRCGYTTPYKHCLVKHLNRNRTCEALHSSQTPQELLKELYKPLVDKIYTSTLAQKHGNGVLTFYTCERCGFLAVRKHSIERHLQKTRPCSPTHSSRDRESILKELRDWRCDMCEGGLTFDCPYRYAAHMKAHHSTSKKTLAETATQVIYTIMD